MTGIGLVTPIGTGKDRAWASAREGRGGIGPLTLFDASAYETRIAGQVKDFEPPGFIDRKEVRRLDNFVLFALAAGREALSDAGLDTGSLEADRCGVIVGSGVGGLNVIEKEHTKLISEGGPRKVSPFLIPMLIPDIASGRLAMAFGLRGPNFAAVSACASGAHAIGTAMRSIQHGEMDIAVTGGTESCITPLGLAGFCNMKALSVRNDEPARASRPFDTDRDGFVMAEGAGIIILEEEERARARRAPVYARLSGYGASADAYHITAPDPDGSGMALAVEAALRDGGVSPGEIDYVNAHGTSTHFNDLVETRALKRVFGEDTRVAISSTKSMTGHMLGAAGAVELAFCCLAIRDGVLPPTINLETPDPDCDLDYIPNSAREARVRHAVSNSFGFGGHNACLLLSRA